MENNNKQDVIIIDEDIALMQTLSIVLNKYEIHLDTFTEPLEALVSIQNKKYAVLIINYMMPNIKCEDFVKKVKEISKDIYIILMSAHRDIAPSIDIMRSLGIQAFFEKGSNFDDLILLIEGGYRQIEQVKEIKTMSTTIENFGIELATILKNSVGARDNYTKEHSDRVEKYSNSFARFLELSENNIKILTLAASFHDIGKIGISDSVLLKPDKLTDEEYTSIKLHPVIGENILSASTIFKNILPLVRHHHERYDGTGYPDKLQGEDIPYLARILAVIDTFDALTSTRVYRKKRDAKEALKELYVSKSTQLDPIITDKFIEFATNNQKFIDDTINSI